MIEILYLTHNRLDFTKASLGALIRNTDGRLVNKLIIYDDNSTDGTREFLRTVSIPWNHEIREGTYGSPVAIMVDYLAKVSPFDRNSFAKIDNDTMVPEFWLNECVRIMDEHGELDLLGIEAFNGVTGGLLPGRSYTIASHIGGIGLMRSSAFVTVPRPNGRFGFTAWQEQNEKVVKGWINPSIPVFLLDRLPREPWQSLSRQYVEQKWQRPWELYTEERRSLWSWWCE